MSQQEFEQTVKQQEKEADFMSDEWIRQFQKNHDELESVMREMEKSNEQ